jgi:hypothetical protein
MKVRSWRLGSVVAVKARLVLSHRNLHAASPPPFYRGRHRLLVWGTIGTFDSHRSLDNTIYILVCELQFCLLDKSEVVLVALGFTVASLLHFTLLFYICCLVSGA